MLNEITKSAGSCDLVPIKLLTNFFMSVNGKSSNNPRNQCFSLG